MFRYLYCDELARFPELECQLYRDRRRFARLGTDTRPGADAEGRDVYDRLNPLNVVWELPDGRHGASVRILPTTGQSVIVDNFRNLTGNVTVRSPFIWECSRFCLSDEVEPRAAAGLMLGILELGLGQGLSHVVGVFATPMTRLFARLGWGPALMGSSAGISAGVWDVDAVWRPGLLEKAGMSADHSAHLYARTFGFAVSAGEEAEFASA